MNNIIILGVNADIGRNICKLYHNEGFNIIGTYRRDFPEYAELAQLESLKLVRCDLTNPDDIRHLADVVRAQNFGWTTVFSSVGTSEPIGRFFELDFDEWEQSVNINMNSQLRAIHALYPLRDASEIVNIALLAGGGTNNPFRCYSAYCVAKIGLIKMCELLDDEADDINIFILGPGFVKTKTHLETLKAAEKAESNYERVKQFCDSEDKGTKFEDIYKCLRWAESMGRETVGGRNLSVVHDQWGTDMLAAELKRDINMYKLRRFRNN
jgi:NAD(P)-dependent dehydrogenase (short-subunit alcohol dehydrogenase family)